MNNFKKNLVKVFLVIFPIVLAVGVLVFIVNRSFYFSDFKNRVEVQVKSENQDSINKFLDTIRNNENVAKVDFERGVIYYQNSDSKVIKENLSILANDEINFEVKEVFTNNRFILENYIFFFVILFITTSATSFYIVFRNRGVITLKEFVTIFTPYTLVYLVSTIFFLGILSLLSRFYFITEFEFLTIYFINILVSVLFFLGIYGYKNNKVISLNSFINIQSLTFKKYSLPFLIFFLTFTPALLIALGTKSLSVWLSLLFGLIAIFLSTRWITLMYFFKYSLDDIKGKFKRSKIDNKEEVKPKNQNSNKPKKNKSKKKKRR